MMLASPIALLWLIPWAGLAVYLLIGRRESTAVPFIELWRGSSPARRRNRQVLFPPKAIVSVIIAIFVSIIAAGGPQFRRPLARPHINVLVDNGVTMCVPGRLPQLLHDAPTICFSAFPSLPQVTLIQAVGDEVIETDASDLPGFADRLKCYPVETQEAIQSKVARLLRDSDDPVVLLSDRRIPNQNPRLFQIAPKLSIENVGFADIALREQPRPQMMLRIGNQSSYKDLKLTIVSGAARIERNIELPERGKSGDYFIDLPEVGPTLKASIDIRDDLPADNTAFLLRTGSNPRLEVKGDVGEALQRMVDVYTQHRPPVESSERVMVCDSRLQLPADNPAVAVVLETSAPGPLKSPLQLSTDHSIMQSVNWKSVDRATVAAAAPGDGWTPLVRSGESVLLAVRAQPRKQVWVGFRSSEFEATRDYVILWSNIFDWIAEGGSQFGYETLAVNGGTLPPTELGIYQRGDGAQAAMNVLNVQFESDPQLLTHLPETPQAPGRGGWIALSPWLALLAGLLVMLSAFWLRLV